MKLPRCEECLFPPHRGNVNNRLRPEKVLSSCFRTGVRFPSAPPCKKRHPIPRLLIRKHEKVSKINVFKGREHGTKSKNLILTGRALIFTSVSFSCPHAIGSRPMAFFHIRAYTHPKNVSIRARKPLFFPLRAPLKGRRGCFPMGSVREAGQGLFCAKINTFQNQRKEAPDMAVFRIEKTRDYDGRKTVP